MFFDVGKRKPDFEVIDVQSIEESFREGAAEFKRLLLKKLKLKYHYVRTITLSEIPLYKGNKYKIIAIKNQIAFFDKNDEMYRNIFCTMKLEYSRFSKKFVSRSGRKYKKYPEFIRFSYSGSCGDVNTINECDLVLDTFIVFA